MRFTRLLKLRNRMTKYKERTVIDDYKKETYISHYCKFHQLKTVWLDLPHGKEICRPL